MRFAGTNRRNALLIAILIAFASCGRQVPEEYIQPEKMKRVLWDITRADELASMTANADSTKTIKQLTTEYYSQIFTIHNITREQFYKSYSFYLENPYLHKDLIDSVYQYGVRTNPQLEKPLLKIEKNQ